MAEQAGPNSPTEELQPAPSLDFRTSPVELKENDVAVLSAALESVFHENYHERSCAEHPQTLSPEIQPPSIDTTRNPPPDIPVPVTSETSPGDPETSQEETSPSTVLEETKDVLAEDHPLGTLSPIPESSPPPTAPHPVPDELISPPGLTTSPAISSDPLTMPDLSSATSGSAGEPPDRVGPEKTPLLASPMEDLPELDVTLSSSSPVDNINVETTSAEPSSEQVSIDTAANRETPTGSTNDLFLSTKTSAENIAEPPLPLSLQSSSNVASALLKRLTNLNLKSEVAMNAIKAVSGELFEEKKEEPRNFPEESRTTSEKRDLNLGAGTTASGAVVVPDGIIGTDSGNSSGKTELETTVTTEVPPINICETLEEIDVVTTEGQREVDVLKSEIAELANDTSSPGNECVVPVQVEVEGGKQDVKKEDDNLPKECVSEGIGKSTVLEDVPVKDKPISEIPIRQRDSSKDPPKKQAAKAADKTTKAPGKVSRVPSQPGNCGGTIAATGSVSATSTLSPRSERGVKQIKSPRPASARSARGLGDLLGSNSGLGILSSPLTGPQRVAAARAAAAAAGVKTRKIIAPASVDGNRSPRDKPSITSTVSNIPAAASVSATSNASSLNAPAVQKRTSGSSTAIHPAPHRRGATGSSATSDVHRNFASFHGYQKLVNSNDLSSLESTYSAILKSFVETKKELQLKTKLAREMFTEIEKLRHLASTKFGKDLPLNEDLSGLVEAAVLRGAAGRRCSEDGNRLVTATEVLLKSLITQRSELLNETSRHHADLLAWCCEAAGDEGTAKYPALLSEKEYAAQLATRVTEVSAMEDSRIAEVLLVLNTSLADLESSKASCRDLRSQLELLNQENSNLTKSLADCTKELEELRTEAGKVAAKKVAVEREAKTLRMKLKETETEIVAEEQKCKELTTQIRSLEDKVRSKDLTQEMRARETERRVKDRISKETEELQRRLDQALKSQQLKESKLEATCHQLGSKLGSVTQMLEMKTKDKEKIEEELKAVTEKLSKITMERSAETQESQRERAALVERLHTMVADEVSPSTPQLKSELQALSDLLDERERIIEEKNTEIKRLKDSCKEGGDAEVSKEEFLELKDTLSRLATHNEMLEQELSKMVQSAAKKDKVMEEQEKVLVIRDQLITMLQGSNHSSTDGIANRTDNVAVQQKILDLQTTIERQVVRIKALESQLVETEKHQDGLQSLRTRYERRIAQLEHALSDQRGTQRSETLTKIRTLLHGNLNQ